MRMLSQVSELPCLTLHIRQVCPQADRKASKQNSCRRQFKMSLQRRLLTVTSDLPGTCPIAYCPPGRGLVMGYLHRGRCPRLLMVVPSRHQSASGLYFTTDLTDETDSCPIWEQNINQKNPLARMESVALMLCFRSGLIRASS